ncbi:MAG: hypothetical protein K0S42_3367 [Microvirga sp.]|jgi:hypothetical protein|nr:hypothetical protein [Microvirga sp.]
MGSRSTAFCPSAAAILAPPTHNRRQTLAAFRGTTSDGTLAGCMKHFYENVPRLGNVAVSRHAQSQMLEAGISQEAFDRALLDPIQPDAPDGQDILWRERDGLRLVILTNPTPNRGAKLVKTVYRVEAQAKAIAGRHR